MKDKIKYIADFLGLDITNKLILEKILEIGDFSGFILFMEENFNHIDLTYKTPLQKFTWLKREFFKKKAEKFSKNRKRKASEFASKLAEKVKATHSIVFEAGDIPYSALRVKDTGERFFSDYEIKVLGSIGSLRQVVELQRSVSGRDLLEERIASILEKRIEKEALLEAKSTTKLLK